MTCLDVSLWSFKGVLLRVCYICSSVEWLLGRVNTSTRCKDGLKD